MHLLTYFSCQHFFTKHQDEYNNLLNLSEKHLSLPQYTMTMTDERCDSWHQTMSRNGTTLMPNKSTMKSPCDTHIISSQPHLAPQILSHHMSKDETGTLYQRTCCNYKLWQHYAATEESIQGIQGDAHAAACLKAYKVRNQLIVNINMKNVLKENTHTRVRKQNQQTSKWSPQSRPSICPFPILTYYLRVTIYGMNRKSQRLQK